MLQLGDGAQGVNRREIDLAQSDQVAQFLEKNTDQISAIFNAAAYTQVDRAETESRLCFLLNEKLPVQLAEFCQKQKIPLVHFSTEFVFDGSGSNPWHEADPPRPINVYGESKLAGELAILRSNAQALIFRTSWVYGDHGKNFVNSILDLAEKKEIMKVVDDQVGAPTSALVLAAKAIEGLKRAQNLARFPTGLLHLCNSGETSRYELASRIIAEARRGGRKFAVKEIVPVKTVALVSNALRPLNSRLNCNKAKTILNLSMPPWQESLEKYILKSAL